MWVSICLFTHDEAEEQTPSAIAVTVAHEWSGVGWVRGFCVSVSCPRHQNRRAVQAGPCGSDFLA